MGLKKSINEVREMKESKVYLNWSRFNVEFLCLWTKEHAGKDIRKFYNGMP